MATMRCGRRILTMFLFSANLYLFVEARRSQSNDDLKSNVQKCNLRLDYWHKDETPKLVAEASLHAHSSLHKSKHKVGYVRFYQQNYRGPVKIAGSLKVPVLGSFSCGTYILTYGRHDCNMKGGKHFNPTKSEHGESQNCVRHVGDLDGISFNEKGSSKFVMWEARIQLQGPTSIIGRSFAIILREEDNDEENELRIACGVIGYANGTNFDQVSFHVPNIEDDGFPWWLTGVLVLMASVGLGNIIWMGVQNKGAFDKMDKVMAAVHQRRIRRRRKIQFSSFPDWTSF